MNRWIFMLVLVLSIPVSLAQSMRVRHDHDPWRSCKGELVISQDGIEYKAEKEKHNRRWAWTDIQSVDRYSPQKFTVLTYKDQRLLLGRDRPFDFTVLEGNGLDDPTFEVILRNLPRPVVDRMTDFSAGREEYLVPVKHLHTFGGCEGVLRFETDRIVYETDHSEDARSWRRDREVVGVWSSGTYDLEVQVRERDGGDFNRTRNFRFQLKKPLNEEYYTQLRRGFLPMR